MTTNKHEKANILIVGAGAVGTTVGYHLGLAGGDITFLVRKGSKSKFPTTTNLYCYDDASLKTFTGYHVVETTDEIVEKKFQYILVALDGTTVRSESGKSLLQKLGKMINTSEAILINCSFGSGNKELYLNEMKIPANRMIGGMFGTLSHSPSANLPVHAPTNPAKLEQARICYKHPANKIGFQVESSNKVAAKEFVELYNKCAVSKASTISPKMLNIVNTFALPIFAAFELSNWGTIASTVADKNLWKLACQAQSEIAGLPKNGFLGTAFSIFLGPKIMARGHLSREKEFLPLDLQAFNQYHYGEKVRSQNIESMVNSLAEGEKYDRSMTALKEILRRLDER